MQLRLSNARILSVLGKRFVTIEGWRPVGGSRFGLHVIHDEADAKEIQDDAAEQE